jgi:hypothetical protein
MPLLQVSRPGILRPTYSAAGGGGDGPTWAPNLPGGLSIIVDRQWNPTDGTISGGVLPPASLTGTDSTGMQWFQASNVAPLINTPASLTSTIGQTIPTLPTSGGSGNATCMAIKYPSGFSAGSTPFGIFVNSVDICTHMYIATWVCIPTGFNSNSNNIKWVFFAQNGSNGRNHVVMLSSGASGSYVGPWIANQGGGGSFNIGGNNNTKTGSTVNLSNANLPALQGTWACFEWEMILEADPSVSSDGICKFWVNNELRGHWTNIKYNGTGDPAGFDVVVFQPFYGGGGSAAPSDQYICLGRFYAAGNG